MKIRCEYQVLIAPRLDQDVVTVRITRYEYHDDAFAHAENAQLSQEHRARLVWHRFTEFEELPPLFELVITDAGGPAGSGGLLRALHSEIDRFLGRGGPGTA